MFERHKGGEKAILVQINFPEAMEERNLDEFQELAISANAIVLGVVTGTRKLPEAKYFIGLGKAEELREQVCDLQAEVVLVNHEISPSQERNLEKFLNCRVVDRSGLILDIFAQRARTFEGRLQVELAQLEHLATRLVRGWTHLERQKGGIGLRGPGEKQLETDRRLLRVRIQYINKRLQKVKNSREQNRHSRNKSGGNTVSLVGYTNAGKSLLFNSLTNENIYTDDLLFATLDPTMRKLDLPGSRAVVLADTVGFIRNLPHHLVKAFQATLEETRSANLILHVIDISDPNWQHKSLQVEKVLEELEVDKSIPVIQVFNKIDLVNSQPKMTANCNRIWVSARDKAGLDYLKEAIATKLYGELVEKEITLSCEQSKLRAKLYSINAILNEKKLEDGGWTLKIRASAQEMTNLEIL
ncbi:MAG: GTPase HflX [Legionellaceae bacterium]|nr:GTPase HflX [Legionellaceae bacterium]